MILVLGIFLVDFWLSNEPNGSSKSTGVVYLDDYIRQHYFTEIFIKLRVEPLFLNR